LPLWKAAAEEKEEDDAALVAAKTNCWLPRSLTAESEVEVAVRESGNAISTAIVRYEANAPTCNPGVDLERMMRDTHRAYHLL
jgi:hypothetical protein